MVAPDDSIEVNALTLLVTPALGDLLHINDITDSNNSFKITIQTAIALYDSLAATLTNKSIVASQLTGIIADARMPNLTGDVTTSEGAVDTTIAAKAVTIAMLADGTDGELITWGTDAVAATVATGSSGQILTSNGAGTAPTFQAGGAADNLGNHTATTDLLMGTNAVQFGIDAAAPASSITYITNLAAGVQYNALTGDIHDFLVNAVSQMTISASTIDFQANTLTDILDITSITSLNGVAIGNYILTTDNTFDTAGTGLTSSASTVNVIGTASRITANANDIDIASDYVGQASITTLGTIGTGTWQGTTVAVNQGGTGVTTSTGTTNVVLSGSPTIVTPTIVSFTNANHDHTNAAGGGALTVGTAVVGTAAQFDTALSDDNFVFDGATNVLTGAIQITAGTMRIPLSATPTMAVDGDFAVDTTITDFSMGLIKYFDGEEMAVPAVPIAQLTTPSDGDAVTYNATTDEFELRTPSGSGDMVLASIQTVTGAKTFADNAFLIQNPAITFEYLFQGGAIVADRTITLPVLTANSTMAFADFANAWGTQNQNIAATGKWQEGGVNTSPIGVHDISMPATAMYPTTTLPCSALAKVELPTNDIDIQTLDFTSTAADERAQFSFPMIRQYDTTATITVTLYWSHAGAATGNVNWRIGALARGQGDAIDTAMTFSADFTDAAGTANQIQEVTSGSFTPGGTPADADLWFMEIMRQGSDAADTFDTTVRLHGAVVHITTDAATAA